MLVVDVDVLIKCNTATLLIKWQQIYINVFLIVTLTRDPNSESNPIDVTIYIFYFKLVCAIWQIVLFLIFELDPISRH